MLSSFHLIPERYGRTDNGQICYINIAHQHTALLTRYKNGRKRTVYNLRETYSIRSKDALTFVGNSSSKDKLYVCCAQRRYRCSRRLTHQQQNLWEGNRRGIHAARAALEYCFRAVDYRRNCTRGTRRSPCLLQDIRRGRTDGTSTSCTA